MHMVKHSIMLIHVAYTHKYIRTFTCISHAYLHIQCHTCSIMHTYVIHNTPTHSHRPTPTHTRPYTHSDKQLLWQARTSFITLPVSEKVGDKIQLHILSRVIYFRVSLSSCPFRRVNRKHSLDKIYQCLQVHNSLSFIST